MTNPDQPSVSLEPQGCAHCGATPDIVVFDLPLRGAGSERHFFCKCPGCLAETGSFDDRTKAVAAWNLRVPASPPTPSAGEGVREALARIIDSEALVTLGQLVADYRQHSQSSNLKWSEDQIQSVAQYAYDQGQAGLAGRREKAFTKADQCIAALAAAPVVGEAFQARVQPWMFDCFGPTIAGDKLEPGSALPVATPTPPTGEVSAPVLPETAELVKAWIAELTAEANRPDHHDDGRNAYQITDKGIAVRELSRRRLVALERLAAQLHSTGAKAL